MDLGNYYNYMERSVVLNKITDCVYTNGWYFMMAKPMKTLELHDPMIQVSVIVFI